MTPTMAAGLSIGWLALREPADDAARSSDLVALVSGAQGRRPWVLHDLGAGTGSMARWLAPRLPGPQRWVLHDRDPALLDAGVDPPPSDAAGQPVSMTTIRGELDDLTAADLAGATVVTASAVLDMLTAAQVERLCAVCTATGAVLLITTTVTGEVGLSPADPLDGPLRRAFNAHQRRAGLLGPDAAARASTTLTSRHYRVTTRHAPWHLGPADSALTRAWLDGWVSAAVAQRPMLRQAAAGYLRRRGALLDHGELWVTVDHLDLFAEPDGRWPGER
jgi:hypothetical protein